MYLVTRSKEARTNRIRLRDPGDGKMKEVAPEGTVFEKAPRADFEVDVVQLSDADAKAHASSQTQAAKVKALADLRTHHGKLEQQLAEKQEAHAALGRQVNALQEELEAHKAKVKKHEQGLAGEVLQPAAADAKGKGAK